jgi:type III secretory pathway component EscV
MEFLSTLTTDVKLLLVAGALALLGGLFSGSPKKEHRYLALFTVLMVVAGVRFNHAQNLAEEAAQQPAPAAGATKAAHNTRAR